MGSGEGHADGREARYHHGDLRDALLRAAERLIEREGLENFTLRACAREAGVSHAAPAHHFGDLAGLLSALAAAAFDQLSAFMETQAAGAVSAGRPALTGLGIGYVQFALGHPGMYRLMFRIEALDREDPVLRSAAEDCHGRLTRTVRTLVANADDEAEVREKAALAWSLVHGYASLALEGHFADDSPAGGDIGDLLAYAIRVLARAEPALLGIAEKPHGY